MIVGRTAKASLSTGPESEFKASWGLSSGLIFFPSLMEWFVLSFIDIAVLGRDVDSVSWSAVGMMNESEGNTARMF